MHLIKIISFFLIGKNIREPEPLILHDSTATTTLKSNQIHYCHLRNWQPPPHFSFSLIHTPKPTSQTYNCYLWCKSSFATQPIHIPKTNPTYGRPNQKSNPSPPQNANPRHKQHHRTNVVNIGRQNHNVDLTVSTHYHQLTPIHERENKNAKMINTKML